MTQSAVPLQQAWTLKMPVQHPNEAQTKAILAAAPVSKIGQTILSRSSHSKLPTYAQAVQQDKVSSGLGKQPVTVTSSTLSVVNSPVISLNTVPVARQLGKPPVTQTTNLFISTPITTVGITAQPSKVINASLLQSMASKPSTITLNSKPAESTVQQLTGKNSDTDGVKNMAANETLKKDDVNSSENKLANQNVSIDDIKTSDNKKDTADSNLKNTEGKLDSTTDNQVNDIKTETVSESSVAKVDTGPRDQASVTSSDEAVRVTSSNITSSENSSQNGDIDNKPGEKEANASVTSNSESKTDYSVEKDNKYEKSSKEKTNDSVNGNDFSATSEFDAVGAMQWENGVGSLEGSNLKVLHFISFLLKL